MSQVEPFAARPWSFLSATRQGLLTHLFPLLEGSYESPPTLLAVLLLSLSGTGGTAGMGVTRAVVPTWVKAFAVARARATWVH